MWQEDFRNWLLARLRHNSALSVYNYTVKYSHLLFENNLAPLQTLAPCKRRHALQALSNLSKYFGTHRSFRELRESFDLKWPSGKSDELVIRRLLKAGNGKSNDIPRWVKDVRERLPELSCFVNLVYLTGMRFVEAINSYNLIVSLSQENSLSNYYADSYLLHYKYPEIFLRRTKRVFISIVPEILIKEIADSQQPLTDRMIQMRFGHRRINLRFSDLREYWASKMTRFLSQPEIDFLMGHVSANVFMMNYFNPALITDLKERTLKGISELYNA